MGTQVRHRASRREKLMPGILMAGVLVIDQLTKLLVVMRIEYTRPPQIAFEAFGDFFRIIHTRNLGIAFSIGRSLPDAWRSVLFVLLPLLVMAGLGVYYWRTRELSPLQRWCLAGVMGGGLGNLVDRIFRPEGVVDFLDVRIYGLFGMERWPTFNVADAAVVVAGILFMVSIIIEDVRRQRRSASDKTLSAPAEKERAE
ncbi:signal peptidase II [Spirochaeta africana]|uniref:Lipoprotein signal peptidase n=1 Tax=Spirochaeta africana (strain ATCC 700263 / DSM 8902 / Z-7692) TaxID=889378 RepID=H9UFP7_SPIAZ|nr:signal peptidase II [Spirochaeta africana]AFG36340.1 lipoprotein signal peptidase [Spirochaeta africana DSM 8902]